MTTVFVTTVTRNAEHAIVGRTVYGGLVVFETQERPKNCLSSTPELPTLLNEFTKPLKYIGIVS
jgi:hypothetical protein